MKLITRTLTLISMLHALGCSTIQSTPLSREGVGTIVRDGPDTGISSLGHAPPEGLPTIVQVVVDKRPLELSGFGLTQEERAQLEKERSRRINQRVEQRLGRFSWSDIANDKQIGLACVLTGPLCPIGLAGFPIVYGTMWVGNQTFGRVATSIQEPSLISEQDGSRIAATLRERATGASLWERTLHLPETAFRPAGDDDDSPRLVIRIKAAQLHSWRRDFAISITAQAQAFLSPGTGWSPTEHFHQSNFHPLAAWTESNDALVRQEIGGALDALARSILEKYRPVTHKSNGEKLANKPAI